MAAMNKEVKNLQTKLTPYNLPNALEGAASILDLGGTLNNPPDVLGNDYFTTSGDFQAIGGYWKNIIDWEGQRMSRAFPAQTPNAPRKHNTAGHKDGVAKAHSSSVQPVPEKDRQRRIDMIAERIADRILKGFPLSRPSPSAAALLGMRNNQLKPHGREPR